MRAMRGKAPRIGTGIILFALLPLLLPAGCKNRALDQAQQETREARATISKLNYNLATATNKMAAVEAELKAVRQDRDELQKQVDRLERERDQASMFAQQAQEAITRLTTQGNSQSSTTVALQKQIAEMKTLIEEQQKLIEQLHKDATVEPAEATEPPSLPTEPNQSM